LLAGWQEKALVLFESCRTFLAQTKTELDGREREWPAQRPDGEIGRVRDKGAQLQNNGEPGVHEMTDGKCTADDEFWDAMERKPDYCAFLDRFDGYKNYWRISPGIWARWDQAKRKSQSEEAFWTLMEFEPDLQALIGRYGGYPRISAETWARWDAANTQYQFQLREGRLTYGVEKVRKVRKGAGQ
jgi:hypothetical protein